MATDIWGDPNLVPDVAWSVLQSPGGLAWMLVVESSSPVLSKALLARTYKKVTARYVFDPRSPSTPQSFAVFIDDDFNYPILSADPDTYEGPLIDAIARREDWLLVLQVLEEGKPRAHMIHVGSDDTVVKRAVVSYWFVGATNDPTPTTLGQKIGT